MLPLLTQFLVFTANELFISRSPLLEQGFELRLIYEVSEVATFYWSILFFAQIATGYYHTNTSSLLKT